MNKLWKKFENISRRHFDGHFDGGVVGEDDRQIVGGVAESSAKRCPQRSTGKH